MTLRDETAASSHCCFERISVRDFLNTLREINAPLSTWPPF